MTAPHHTAPEPPAPRTAPDWRTMAPADFDTTAAPEPLFELEPSAVSPVDACGTGDLLELIPPELAPLYEAALPADAPGAWIRDALEEMMRGT